MKALERCWGRQRLAAPTQGALVAEGASGTLDPSEKSKGDLPERSPPGAEASQGGSGWDETQSKTALIIPKPTVERWRRGLQARRTAAR